MCSVLKAFHLNIEVREQQRLSPKRNTKFYLFYAFLALLESASGVSQARKLCYCFKNKMKRAPLKVQYIFSLQNLNAMFISLSYVLNVKISQSYNKNNFFILLFDTCYLVYRCFLLKQGVATRQKLNCCQQCYFVFKFTDSQ